MLLVPTAAGLKACEYGPLTTSRKRMAVACKCVGHALGVWVDPRVRALLQIGRAYAERTATRAEVTAALRAADGIVAAADRDATAEVWSIFEGRRAGRAAEDARTARTATDAVRWALGTGGRPPRTGDWNLEHDARAEPRCDAAWRTPDVLALAQLVQSGDTGALPILADALQDAGCDDDLILAHCRDERGEHCPRCWVPDLILDAE